MLVLGLLPSVTINTIILTNLTTLRIAWQPPFSLNLTQSEEPSVWYCIDISGVCGINEWWSHRNCSVYQPWYSYSYAVQSDVLVEMLVAHVTPVNAFGYGNISEATSVVIEIGNC